jgi:hypothetical protein
MSQTAHHGNGVQPLRDAVALALQRHAEQRERQPTRPAAAYLRVALQGARQMQRLARHYYSFWQYALNVVDAVIHAAYEAEEALFAAGSNSATYLTVISAAEALRLQLLDARKDAADALVEKHQGRTADPARAHSTPRQFYDHEDEDIYSSTMLIPGPLAYLSRPLWDSHTERLPTPILSDENMPAPS